MTEQEKTVGGTSEVDLFSPITIRGVTFKNRIGVSPMCQYSAEDGFPGDWHLVHLGARAIGGAGLIIAEATAVEPRGRITPGCTGIWKDEHIPAWKRVTDFVKQYNSVIGIQIAHSGRKGSAARPWEGDASISEAEGGWETVGPSSIAFGGALTKVPKELTIGEIQEIKDAFVQAAIRSNKAGFQFLELHFAHGYLSNSFYSPLANKREDQYGGSFENRIRLVVEIATEVRKVWPDNYPLSARISSVDWIEGGWTIEDSVKLSTVLKSVGVDIIDCSSGANDVNSFKNIPWGPSFQVPFAEKIKKEVGIYTAAVGFLTEPEQLNEIIKSGKADFTLIARQSLIDPNFPYHAAKALNKDSQFIKDNVIPIQYGFWIERK